MSIDYRPSQRVLRDHKVFKTKAINHVESDLVDDLLKNVGKMVADKRDHFPAPRLYRSGNNQKK